ncbi:MAG: DUF21 domain-containing protein [Planctomycetota bacterium]|jgi:hypothetical protein
MHTAVWIGIAICASQSALFSGLNLAVFGISRLRLETEAATGRPEAVTLLTLRQDSNFLLTTILWGNVGVNVLLALLSNSVMAGVSAFLFSTIVITFLGEIIPQAYFVRNAMTMGARLAPVLRFYQFVLYPVAKPSALMLDWLLGAEVAEYFREHDLKELLQRHAVAHEAKDVSALEGIGAANFLSLDDVPLEIEGEPVAPLSIVALPFSGEHPVFPEIRPEPGDPFLLRVHSSRHKWVILTDEDGEPRLVMDADGFLRDALFHPPDFRPLAHCHRPIVSRDPTEHLGALLPRLRVQPRDAEDDVVDHDIVLLWGHERRVITGSDILGRLLRGITRIDSVEADGA